MITLLHILLFLYFLHAYVNVYGYIVKFQYEGLVTKLRISKDNSKPSKKYTKSNLPVKICKVCGRPFEWRKKWEKVWDEVKYCSDKCRGHRNTQSNETITSNSSYSNPNGNYIPKSINKLNVKDLDKAAYSAMIVSSSLLSSLYPVNAKVLSRRPALQEIQDLFVDCGWKDEKFTKFDFRRLDESSDFNFYTYPRFVEHIDEAAVKALTSYHDREIQRYYESKCLPANSSVGDKCPGIDILDLCSSWVSHVSLTTNINQFVGVGMNELELRRNAVLTEFSVQNLNQDFVLKYQNNSFDLVLLQLSIDYLIHPIEVMSEVHRVLKPGGCIVVSFSNRVFIDKAVSVWTGKSDIEHMEIVCRYIYFARGFREPFQIQDISPSITTGDPLYVIMAVKI